MVDCSDSLDAGEPINDRTFFDFYFSVINAEQLTSERSSNDASHVLFRGPCRFSCSFIAF